MAVLGKSMSFWSTRHAGVVGIIGGVIWVVLSLMTLVEPGSFFPQERSFLALSAYVLPVSLFLPALMALYLRLAQLVGWWGRVGILIAGIGLGWLWLHYSGLESLLVEGLLHKNHPVTPFHMVATGLIFTGFVAMWRQPVLQPLPRWSLLAVTTGVCGLSMATFASATVAPNNGWLAYMSTGLKLLFGACWALLSYTLLLQR